jgi:hypothetical protein
MRKSRLSVYKQYYPAKRFVSGSMSPTAVA